MAYTTAHEVQNHEKVECLAQSMAFRGWDGAPVVTWEDSLQITGVHRAVAAKLSDTEMETIDLAEVFEEDGADYEAACADFQSAESDNPFSAIADYMLPYLSTEIKAKYGIDLE